MVHLSRLRAFAALAALAALGEFAEAQEMIGGGSYLEDPEVREILRDRPVLALGVDDAWRQFGEFRESNGERH